MYSMVGMEHSKNTPVKNADEDVKQRRPRDAQDRKGNAAIQDEMRHSGARQEDLGSNPLGEWGHSAHSWLSEGDLEAQSPSGAGNLEHMPVRSNTAHSTPVQAKGPLDGANIHAAAAQGSAGASGKLPFFDQIQASFGRFDISGIRANVGGSGEAACESMGAHAYASGSDIVFKSSPDLHTAAHEAAHVVQQRGGVSLHGGVGQEGDTYEQHADEVADLVVQGKSAESALEKMSGTPGTAQGETGEVQMIMDDVKDLFNCREYEAIADVIEDSYDQLSTLKDIVDALGLQAHSKSLDSVLKLFEKGAEFAKAIGTLKKWADWVGKVNLCVNAMQRIVNADIEDNPQDAAQAFDQLFKAFGALGEDITGELASKVPGGQILLLVKPYFTFIKTWGENAMFDTIRKWLDPEERWKEEGFNAINEEKANQQRAAQ